MVNMVRRSNPRIQSPINPTFGVLFCPFRNTSRPRPGQPMVLRAEDIPDAENCYSVRGLKQAIYTKRRSLVAKPWYSQAATTEETIVHLPSGRLTTFYEV